MPFRVIRISRCLIRTPGHGLWPGPGAFPLRFPIRTRKDPSDGFDWILSSTFHAVD